MPRKQKGAYHPNYTKVFSNIANPFQEVEFIKDDRDPFEELQDLPRYASYQHWVQDFEFGLQDILEIRYEMWRFALRHKAPHSKMVEWPENELEAKQKLRVILEAS